MYKITVMDMLASEMEGFLLSEFIVEKGLADELLEWLTDEKIRKAVDEYRSKINEMFDEYVTNLKEGIEKDLKEGLKNG